MKRVIQEHIGTNRFIYNRNKIIKSLFVFVLLIFVIHLPASALRRTWSIDKFVYEAILGIDLVENSVDRILVWGKNYEKAEAKVSLVEIQNKKVKTIWESTNLYERGSNLMCAVGKFTSSDNEAIILTENGWKIYKIESNGLKEIASGQGITGIMEVTSGDVDGDGRSELIITSVAQLLENTVNKKIVVYKYQNGTLEKYLETEGFGNIRALTSLDLDGDGKSEIVFEEGQGYRKGTITVLQDLKPILSVGLRDHPVFALSRSNDILLVGDDSGSVNLYRYKNVDKPELILIDKSVSVGWGLVDAARGDFLGLGKDQVILISSPAKLSVLED